MQKMELKTLKAETKETFVVGEGITVTVYDWANREGCSFMVHEENSLSLRVSGSLRWEEVDALLVALTAARSA